MSLATALGLSSSLPTQAGVLSPNEAFTPGDKLQGWRLIDLQEFLERTDGLIIQLSGQKIPFSHMRIDKQTKEVALRRVAFPCLRGKVEQDGKLLRFVWENGDIDLVKPLIKMQKIRLLPFSSKDGEQLDFLHLMIYVRKPFEPCEVSDFIG